MTGILELNPISGRLDIRGTNPDGTRGLPAGGLHCGQPLQVLHHGQWNAVTVEYNEESGWYLTHGIGYLWREGMYAQVQ